MHENNYNNKEATINKLQQCTPDNGKKLLKNIKTRHEIGRRNLREEREERGQEPANTLKEYV